ncbi:hypothetical protein HPB52_024055 [Rhipicephalus sanguineus]|uniref:Uncharacterized protein n=1 Tax=Rhipicephalus sanguineus TaxID=34632 RepID=A0A9D4Q893_RHISA|nr:hypothetical protein HPB52_024055 [Rhipicephalus sanguineus]
MFQPAEAWQPQFDPPLPPFRTYNLESWFEEFAAALELNGIWLQAFMFEVLEYHLPRDLKRSLTYFAWHPRPYDDLRDAVLDQGSNSEALRELVQSIVKEELQKLLQPQVTPTVSTLATIIRDEVRHALLQPEPEAQPIRLEQPLQERRVLRTRTLYANPPCTMLCSQPPVATHRLRTARPLKEN